MVTMGMKQQGPNYFAAMAASIYKVGNNEEHTT
jgi:hypothetical protein